LKISEKKNQKWRKKRRKYNLKPDDVSLIVFSPRSTSYSVTPFSRCAWKTKNISRILR